MRSHRLFLPAKPPPHRHHFFPTLQHHLSRPAKRTSPSHPIANLSALDKNGKKPAFQTKRKQNQRNKKKDASRGVPGPYRRRFCQRSHPRRNPRHSRLSLRHVLPVRRLRWQRDSQQGRAGCLPALRGTCAVQAANEAVSALSLSLSSKGLDWPACFATDF